LEGNTGSEASAMRASRSSEGRYLMAYTPTGMNVTVNLDKLSGDRARAWWFSPRTGHATAISTFGSSGARTFDPPGDAGRGNDWVLVVDDAAQGYRAPGLAR
ncbi:MAG TPA: putative collagen-binding domain-containing protein, partial [Rhodothermales bacterium]|nr:putative collagen-binding domain-containing protein [Rhodothermales bacterium]